VHSQFDELGSDHVDCPIVLLFLALPLFTQESTAASQAVPADVMKQLEALAERVEQFEQQLKSFGRAWMDMEGKSNA
jgi:hypothetical protein